MKKPRKRSTEVSGQPSLDRKDEAIIHCIEEQPEILLKNISSRLKETGSLKEEIPYPTVQRRVKTLTEGNVLGHHFSVNWALAGYLVRYRVGIIIDPAELRAEITDAKPYDTQEGLAGFIVNNLAKGSRYRNRLVVDDVYILLGDKVDLALDFYARDDKTATLFIINGLRRCYAVRNTTSAKISYSSKYGWLSKDGDEQDVSEVSDEETQRPNVHRL